MAITEPIDICRFMESSEGSRLEYVNDMFQYNKKDSASPNHQRFFKVDTYLGSECLKGYLTSRKKKKKPKNERFGCTNRRHESQKRIEEIVI